MGRSWTTKRMMNFSLDLCHDFLKKKTSRYQLIYATCSCCLTSVTVAMNDIWTLKMIGAFDLAVYLIDTSVSGFLLSTCVFLEEKLAVS